MPRITPCADRDCESCRNDAAAAGRAEVIVEDVRVEGAGEQPAIVAVRLRDEHQNVGQLSLLDAHEDMLP